MPTSADQVQRNLIDYVLTLDPAEGMRELSCLLSAVAVIGEQLKGGVDPVEAGSVLIIVSGVAQGALEQIAKPGGLQPAPQDPAAMCATQIVAAQIATLKPGQV